GGGGGGGRGARGGGEGGGGASERLSAISEGAIAAAIKPIGTLTHSTHCQPIPSVRMPPSSTPAAPPLPATAPQTPSALLRSAPSRNVVGTIDSAAGERMRGASPCAARAGVRRAEVRDRAPATHATGDSCRHHVKSARAPR